MNASVCDDENRILGAFAWGLMAPWLLVVALLVLGLLHGCSTSRPEATRILYDDPTLSTDSAFQASCADPATDDQVLVNLSVYRCTTRSSAAGVKSDFERVIRGFLDAYPMVVEVHVRRYHDHPLSWRYPGIVSLGWFVRNGVPVVESCSWEIERLAYWSVGGSDDSTPLPSENVARHDAVIRALGGTP